MRSILLDFCNRDIRLAANLFSNLDSRDHSAVLGYWLNLAAFLTPNITVLPLGFPAECDILQSALDRKWEFLENGLIRIASRETSISAFLEKRRQEYKYKSESYPILYRTETETFLSRLAPYLLARQGQSGESIASLWENRRDDAFGWSSILQNMPAVEVDKLRTRPRILKDRGDAVLWSDVANVVSGTKQGTFVRDLLNSDMLDAYRTEYALDVLTNLPFGWRDILNIKGRNSLNIDNLKIILGNQTFDLICKLPASQILELKRNPDILHAIDVISAFPSECDFDPHRIRAAAAFALQSVDAELRELFPRTFSLSFISEISVQRKRFQILETVIEGVAKNLNSLTPEPGTQSSQRPQVMNDIKPKEVAIFAALEMEAKIVAKELNLSARSAYTWHGHIGNARAILYSPMAMGRVAAAVSTMKLLSEVKPSLIIVVGIAGGFSVSSGFVGQIVVPENVIDLSLRKIYEDEGTEFRPTPYNLDVRLRDFLRSPQFPHSEWSFEAAEIADWPSDRRPSLNYGDITSLDEVVANHDHIDRILKAYPKLVAVEMEAGGVCAAARSNGVAVSVVRGISDQADPAKRDDDWRKRVLLTLVDLLKHLNYDEILA